VSRGSHPLFGLDYDLAITLLNDAEADGQSQSGSLVSRLRGEEKIDGSRCSVFTAIECITIHEQGDGYR